MVLRKVARISKVSIGDRTRAYTMGLSGLYFNLKGRGVHAAYVKPGAEADALSLRLIAKLVDYATKKRTASAFTAIYASPAIFKGPYVPDAPRFHRRVQRGVPNVVGSGGR
jgi:hypothetical protein